MIKEYDKDRNEGGTTIADKIICSEWDRLPELVTIDHYPLTDNEELEANKVRINKQKGFEIPFFILGLETKYPNDLIENFMLDILDVNCVVDSIKKRSSNKYYNKNNNKEIYDVHLWVRNNNFLRLLAIDDIFSDILTTDIHCHESISGIKDYIFDLSPKFFGRGKNIFKIISGHKSTYHPMGILINRYCNDSEALFKELDQ